MWNSTVLKAFLFVLHLLGFSMMVIAIPLKSWYTYDQWTHMSLFTWHCERKCPCTNLDVRSSGYVRYMSTFLLMTGAFSVFFSILSSDFTVFQPGMPRLILGIGIVDLASFLFSGGGVALFLYWFWFDTYFCTTTGEYGTAFKIYVTGASIITISGLINLITYGTYKLLSKYYWKSSAYINVKQQGKTMVTMSMEPSSGVASTETATDKND
ncbi:unnamed protein product [Bursaphelenchus okinawaensis]|uniref:Uncharacterized protein n=1 Tax=Bursaphelenchus okinawaensis TaxID=465554 RepID=A0A811KAZ4_9BILA|nr:unnamed protein product [Bursaphelenchus okinawaensis]CAG9098301.1 unnamed protein product [Bursaphelenchus okinawaensis]